MTHEGEKSGHTSAICMRHHTVSADVTSAEDQTTFARVCTQEGTSDGLSVKYAAFDQLASYSKLARRQSIPVGSVSVHHHFFESVSVNTSFLSVDLDETKKPPPEKVRVAFNEYTVALDLEEKSTSIIWLGMLIVPPRAPVPMTISPSIHISTVANSATVEATVTATFAGALLRVTTPLV